ncbi:MAG: HD domain-containing protein [Bacillota bacterium]|nr:HD domain-containing protein [Bacillota bacterium]
MINIKYAKQAFEKYLSTFDRNNPKISLKIIHTYGVVYYTQLICEKMMLNNEDTDLSLLIALLHDIGRFEQVRIYDSFEHTTMSHAHYGVELLKKNQFIRQFVKDDTYDEIIYQAIYHHSDYQLDPSLDPRTMFFCQMIRDADKLDNCRVKLHDSIEILLNETIEEVGSEAISEKVWEACLKKSSVLLSDRKTKIDYWVSYIAYFFDINFKESFQIIEEKKFVSKIIHRISYSNQETYKKMILLEELTNAFVQQKIKE